MAASRILRALPATPLRLAPACRPAIATPATRRTYSSATNTTATITDTPAAAAAAAPSPLTQAPPTASAAAETQTAAQAERRADPNYFVARTPSSKLPIYEDKKTGPRTLLRKIEGDAGALRLELMRLLQLDDKTVWVNPRTNHIRIKGHVKAQLEPILKDMGF